MKLFNSKKTSINILAAGYFILNSAPSLAIPMLQLDIAGGTYDLDTETIVSSGNSFTLYAYLITKEVSHLNTNYYISASIAPKIDSSGGNIGSFNFNGTTINATGDMTFGVPPIEAVLGTTQGFDAGDLSKHDVFPTYFSEFGFQFNSTNQITAYDTQERAIDGDPIPTSGSGMYFAAFTLDTSSLDPDYVLHFDLYNTELFTARRTGLIDIDADDFARFSHDAQSSHREVPEPSTLLLFGIGFLWLWGQRFGFKLKKTSPVMR